jgi:heme-degrading protein
MKRRILKIAALAAIFSVTITARAQVMEKKTLTIDGAKRVIAAAAAEAKKLNAPGGVIAVVDDGGNLMALERLDGTFAAGANISIGKARTSVLFKKPTKVFSKTLSRTGVPQWLRYRMPSLRRSKAAFRSWSRDRSSEAWG